MSCCARSLSNASRSLASRNLCTALLRAADSNTDDLVTHIETWTTLRVVAGRIDFRYFADSTVPAVAS